MAPRKRKPVEWPADQVERRRVADLVPYARNARVHSEAQVAQIAASIEQFGFTIPVLIDESGGLIAGHGRVMAAKKSGLETIPCIIAKGWTEAQKRAYVIADNKLAENSTWDSSLLKLELGEIRDLGFELTMTGFDLKGLESIFSPTDGIENPPASSYKQQYGVIVLCSDELEQKREFDALTKAGKKVRIVVT